MKSHGNLRVLLLAWNYPPALGGIEDVACHLADSLRQSGFDLRGIARAGAREAAGALGVHRPKRPGLRRYLLFSFWQGLVHCIRERPHMIVCPGIVDAPTGSFLATLFRIRLVLLAHGSDVVHGGAVYRFVVRFLFRRADGIAANSANTVRLLSDLGCKPERIRLIHPGIDAGAFRVDVQDRARIRAQLDVADRRVVLSAGRVIRRKGIHLFVTECLPGLVKAFPDLLYVIAGGDASESLVHHESLLAEIRESVERLGLSENVLITGKVTDADLRAYYQAADVFLMPAIEVPGDVEGFGIVFLEAAAAEVPAVATVCGGIPEAVVHNKTGLLVAPGDWMAIERAVSTLLHDDNFRRRLGAAACARAFAEFDWSKIGAAYREEILVWAGQHQGDGHAP